VLIDNFLQKATKADKKPHWCVEHQKWEIEPHEKAVMELSKKVGPDPHQAPVSGYPFGGAGFPLPPEDTENIHEPTIPIMLDTERGWNPFKRQQKPNPSTVTPSTPPQKETEGERMDRIITERRKQKGIQQSLLKVMERPDEEDDPYGHKEARRNPASIAQRWEGEAALAVQMPMLRKMFPQDLGKQKPSKDKKEKILMFITIFLENGCQTHQCLRAIG